MRHQIISKLLELDQAQLVPEMEALAPKELEKLWTQVQKYDADLTKQQKKLLNSFPASVDCVPCHHFSKSGNAEYVLQGEMLIREGKVGCLVLAGGQGTRLGVDVPKGTVAVSAIEGKSLFQLICEKCHAAGVLARKKLPLCIMTSELNHDQTVSFFEKHGFFGLDPEQVSFFKQQMLPFVDDLGCWHWEAKGKIAEGPDGNGHALRLFFETGIGKNWKSAGVEYLNVIFVDNPLADPFDSEFVGFTATKNLDATLKAIQRESPFEKMGVVGESKGQLKVIEYSEIPADSSAFTLSSTGMFCLKMQFVESLSNKSFPLHLARKKANVIRGEIPIWKSERFIFDLLDFTTAAGVLVFPREMVYAPLKNASGDKSLQTVKKALLLRDKEQYLAITGKVARVDEFELHPSFYYPSPEMKQWLTEHTLLNKSYVESGLTS